MRSRASHRGERSTASSTESDETSTGTGIRQAGISGSGSSTRVTSAPGNGVLRLADGEIRRSLREEIVRLRLFRRFGGGR
ncbi:hypothetical protein [Breoghania sp.]|uniref:hypothetical protein n=1 Tax=Breoghania sp. TaxID=2065378 RepID=UPI002608B831|nr:hypothetical protein [Breoghania sp.]